MVLGCGMILPSGEKNNQGSITVKDWGLHLAKSENTGKKAVIAGLLGGALGGAIAGAMKPTPFKRVEWSDILSIRMKDYKRKKNACYLTLKDNSEYILFIRNPKSNIPILQMKFNDLKNRKKEQSIFKD